MGRFVDLNKPLSDEDRAYLLARSREYQVVGNDRRFGHLTEDEKEARRNRVESDEAEEAEVKAKLEAELKDEEELGYDEDLVDEVGVLKVVELRDRLEEVGQPIDGQKAELQQRLLDYLQDARDLEKAQ